MNNRVLSSSKAGLVLYFVQSKEVLQLHAGFSRTLHIRRNSLNNKAGLEYYCLYSSCSIGHRENDSERVEDFRSSPRVFSHSLDRIPWLLNKEPKRARRMHCNFKRCRRTVNPKQIQISSQSSSDRGIICSPRREDVFAFE